ncbi:unnamed protein product [Orchesella dallaii]|uniref:C2H2-type domain-containing protein n=1 Tax=Orchesella dallaii TaxID=48710 RepID=A0ABP1RHM0_9HEXA
MSSYVCFVCAKTFKPKPSNSSATQSDKDKGQFRIRATRSRGKEESSLKKLNDALENKEKEEDLFHRILTSYLNLSADLGLPAIQGKGTLFCSSCASLINSLYGDYKELRAVELRLSSKLGNIGEVMMQKPKLGESLLKKLAEQFMILKKKGGGQGTETSYVQKGRNVIAQELVLKGKKAELELEWGYLDDKTENGCQTQQVEDDREEEEEDERPANANRKEERDGEHAIKIKTEVVDDGFDDFDESFLNSPAVNSPVNPSKTNNGNEKADDNEKEDSDSSYDGANEIPSEADDDSDNSDGNWSSDADKKRGKQATKRKKASTTTQTQIKPTAKRRRSAEAEYEYIQSRTGDESFSNRTSKKLGVEDSDGPFHCDQCGKDYDKWQHFWKHLTRIHEEPAQEKTVNCPFCWMSFAFPQSFSYHLKARHEETISKKVFTCDADYAEEDIVDPSTPRFGCDESFEKIEELNSHLETHTSLEKIYHCPKCNCGFLNPHMRELHELLHIRGYRGNHKCPKCGIFSAGFSKFRDHYNLRHGAKLLIHKCHLCSATCLSRVSLRNHLKAHDTGKLPLRSSSSTIPSLSSGPQVCELCGQQYKGAKADVMLERHMKRIHSGSEITCSICSKVFHYGIQYDKHMKSEHQISKLPCSICKKELGSTRRLREHMNIVHAAEPEQHLCPHCGATFKTVRYLQRHIVWMHKELVEVKGKHVCERCGERFHRIELFTRHKKINNCQKMEEEEEMGGTETVCIPPTAAAEVV